MSLSHREKLVIAALQWLTAILLGLCAFTLFKTFGPVKPPINVAHDAYHAKKMESGDIVVYFNCFSEIMHEFEGHIHREAQHVKSGLVVNLPTSVVKFVPGNRNVVRQFYIPAPVPSGEWCVTSRLEWRPAFSLRDRETVSSSHCFEVL